VPRVVRGDESAPERPYSADSWSENLDFFGASGFTDTSAGIVARLRLVTPSIVYSCCRLRVPLSEPAGDIGTDAALAVTPGSRRSSASSQQTLRPFSSNVTELAVRHYLRPSPDSPLI